MTNGLASTAPSGSSGAAIPRLHTTVGIALWQLASMMTWIGIEQALAVFVAMYALPPVAVACHPVPRQLDAWRDDRDTDEMAR